MRGRVAAVRSRVNGEVVAGKQNGSSPPAEAGDTRWVNLARACEILGVNESTVRRWADTGEIRCYRTPGGHRRFAEEDMLAITNGRSAPERELGNAAVSRIRRQLHSGGHREAGWYGEMEADEREMLRPLGRRLVEIVDDYIARRGRRTELEREVSDIGEQYGRQLRARGMPLHQAMQAFTFFRRSLDQTAKQLADRNRLTSEDASRAREDIAGLADRVLLGLTTAYDPAS
ncbi:MAG: helix-turn-helix domain-containing protein [Dehalococcoidia bacterium]|nr:helix-turn-helix domain-containing protein [Dehalococcoidia bacterium]